MQTLRSRVLRVGYLSPDFRQHTVTRFFLPLIQNHDPNKEIEKAYEVERELGGGG